MVEPFIEFLTANHLKLPLALNDHVAPGVDLEIQKTRHAPAFEQLATNDSFMQELCGTGSSARIQRSLILSDVLAVRPSSVLVQCLMSFTLSHSCDKKKFRDEMFPKYSAHTISGMLATSK